MGVSIFGFRDYKKYLSAVIEGQPGGGRGFRGKLADAVLCQRAFVSQVLSGGEHFNLEHGDRINAFLGHDSLESHYFFLLIQLARAGSDGVRDYFSGQIKEVLNRRLVLKNRLKSDGALSAADKSRYYGAWYYGAIRVALANPKLRTREALQRHFGLTSKKVADVLEFLVSAGLAVRKGDQYALGTAFMHLGNDSSLIVRHHTNWRIKALSSLERERATDLHFSSVWSISERDAVELRAILADFLENVQNRARESRNEVLYSFCIDFFEV